MIEREIDFLNEQLEDADLYIQNMVGLLEEKTITIEQETARRTDVECRFSKLNKEIHEKAKMDVKVSILERDLSISNSRVFELESKLDEEYQKREPLEQEIDGAQECPRPGIFLSCPYPTESQTRGVWILIPRKR